MIGGGGKLVVCKNCEYEWETSSKLRFVTCPSCGKKTPTQALEEGK